MSNTAHRPLARSGRRLWLLVAAAALGLAALAALLRRPAPPPPVTLTPEERAWLASHGPPRFAPDPNFAPIEWIDDQGVYRGLFADLFELIQQRIGVRFVIVRARDWDDVFRMAKARQIDGVPASQPTPERAEYMRYSPPVMAMSDGLIVRKGTETPVTMESLGGKRLAITGGSAQIAAVRARNPRIIFDLQPNARESLLEVSFGRADAAQVNLAAAAHVIQSEGIANLKYGGDVEGAPTDPMAIATRSDEPLLASIIAKGLASVTPAEREEIRRRWVDFDLTSAPAGKRWLQAAALLLVLATLGLSVVLLGNAALRRQVAAATADLKAELAERRRAEDALARAQRMESLAALAGGIAHDFNNLLTGILANLAMAREPIPPAELPELLSEAEAAARRARDLTRQLLTFAKGGAPVTRVVDLAPLVQETASFATRGASATCRVRAEHGLWPVAVDPGQFAQVVQNLVINAAEAMPAGGAIEIELDNARVEPPSLRPAPGAYVRLRVTDQGQGIPADVLPRIFDPFFSTKERGSGLGLAVTHSVVERHGGAIEARSQPGAGTTFEIYLPALPDAIAAEPVRAAKPGARRGRVLVMDDEELLLRAASRAIGTVSSEVVVASDGAQAVDLWQKARAAGQPFDVVVVDLTVPGGIGGVETLRRMRAIDPAVKVVVSSGYSDAAEMSDHAARGFAAVLPKPYSLEDVRRVIGGLLP